MIYLLLVAGLFMGWSLGTVDAAGAFGTAVATGVIKYRTAIIIIAILVIIGSIFGGANNINKLAELSTSNEVIASEEAVLDAIEHGEVEALRFKSALKAALVFSCSALTVFIMSYLKLPVSSTQAIIGAIIGWGLFHADYSDPEILAINLPQIAKFASTWLLNPLGAGLVSFIIVWSFNKFIAPRMSTLRGYDTFVKLGYLGAGIVASFSIGLNSSASVTALYYDTAFSKTGIAANLLTDARIAATIGGVAISIGVLTFSKRIMMTVGGSIADITQIDGFLVIIAMSITVVLMGRFLGIPVSTSQAIVGAVIGAGLTKGRGHVNFGVFRRISIAWVTSPTAAALLTYVVAFATQGIFN